MAYLTDQEIIERFNYYTLQVEEGLKGNDFESVINDLPCSVVLSRSQAIEIEYTNKNHSQLTGYSIEEIRAGCSEYLNNIIHPASLKNIKKFLPDFYSNKKSFQTMSFVQYVQVDGKSEYTPLITFTKSPRKADDLVIRLTLRMQEFQKLSPKMEQIIRMDQFKLKHFNLFQQLTEREVEILKLLANGDNNPGIAEKLFLARQTVETHRKNIKRKLELQSFRDLMKYAFAFDLIDC
ncbi:MAG: helix-turn-helix transcriptional regulator [Balneolaceae bacterium]